MHMIPEYMHDEVGYYVYGLIDPRDGKPFYIGKGRGNRLFQHVNEALTTEDRSTLKLDRIREIKHHDLDIPHVIYRHVLSEKEAFEVEAALIDAYGLGRDALSELTNVVGGHHGYRGKMSVDDLIARYTLDEAVFDVPVVVVKLSRQFERQLSPEELYERSRGIWKANPQLHRNVNFAIPVSSGGVIREVYRILRWFQVDVSATEESALRRKGVDAPSKTMYRWMFDGAVDEVMRERYVGRRVPDLEGQSPVRWLGPALAEGTGPAIDPLPR